MTTDDPELLSHSMKRFAARELEPRLQDIEHGAGLPREVVDGLAALGLLQLDAADGGLGLLATALQSLSRTTAAPAALLLSHAVARQLLVDSEATNGSSKVRALAVSEPHLLAYPLYAEAASTTGELEVQRLDGDVLLDGRAELVVGAPIADLLVLPVTDREVVVLDRETPGMRIDTPLMTLGMRGCPVADVWLERVRVPRERCLPVAVERVARRFRGPAAAIAAGLVERSLETATSYALERYQGGTSIIAHQQVRAMLTRLLADSAACRDAARRLSQESLAEHEAMALFIDTKERATRATVDGVQLLGGYGYMEEYGQERCLRDARQAQCLLGRTDVQRQALASDWLERGTPS